jgi:hypothetical protein
MSVIWRWKDATKDRIIFAVMALSGRKKANPFFALCNSA